MATADLTPQPLDWHSDGSVLLLNPRLPAAEKAILTELSQRFAQSGHVWIASSGSSQKSQESLKLIALGKQAFLQAALAANVHLQAGADDVWIRALPRFHVGGLAIELRAQLSRAQVFVGFREENTWDPNFYLQSLRENKGTLSALVPTQIHDLLQAGVAPPPSLRAVIVGGAALAPELYQRAKKQGWPLLPSYGLTECCSQVATAELDSLTEAPLQLPPLRLLKHCQVRLNKEGFLQIKSSSLLTGFAQKVHADWLWKTPVQDGWYTTSDKVNVSTHQQKVFLQPLGRDEDFIKLNGEGISLSKLRDVLAATVQSLLPSAHSDVVLLDLPHARSGAELVFIGSTKVKSAAAVVENMRNHYNSQVSSIERVQRVLWVDEIPRSALGKVQWEALRSLSARI